jgi:hypothetical protein
VTVLLATTTLLVTAQTATTTNFNASNPVALIPDGNPVEITEQFNVSGLAGGISNVPLKLVFL